MLEAIEKEIFESGKDMMEKEESTPESRQAEQMTHRLNTVKIRLQEMVNELEENASPENHTEQEITLDGIASLRKDVITTFNLEEHGFQQKMDTPSYYDIKEEGKNLVVGGDAFDKEYIIKPGGEIEVR